MKTDLRIKEKDRVRQAEATVQLCYNPSNSNRAIASRRDPRKGYKARFENERLLQPEGATT